MNKHPTKVEQVLAPTPCAYAVARAYGSTSYVLVTRSVYQLGRKLGHTCQRIRLS